MVSFINNNMNKKNSVRGLIFLMICLRNPPCNSYYTTLKTTCSDMTLSIKVGKTLL